MLAMNYTQFRKQLKANLDKVVDDCEPIVVTRKENRNVVIISEEAYNNMLENMHLVGNHANYNWLMESKAQLEQGSAAVHPLSGDLAGFWSRRINEKDRLVYRIAGDEVQILTCRYHYQDK